MANLPQNQILNDVYDDVNKVLKTSATVGSATVNVGDVGLVDETETAISDSNPLAIMDFGKLVPKIYDYIALTYVTSGNGVGEIETVTYKSGGSGGTTEAVLTLTYDVSNKLETVTRS